MLALQESFFFASSLCFITLAPPSFVAAAETCQFRTGANMSASILDIMPGGRCRLWSHRRRLTRSNRRRLGGCDGRCV